MTFADILRSLTLSIPKSQWDVTLASRVRRSRRRARFHPSGARRRRERGIDQQLLLARVARGGSFRGARAARARDEAHRPPARRLDEMRTDELPRAHVLGLFLHPH